MRVSVSAVGTVLVVAVVALCLSIASNIGLAVQAHENCKSIELLKAQTRTVLEEQYDDLLSGKLDDDLRRFYGADWPQRKADAILLAEKRIARFKPRSCPFFIR